MGEMADWINDQLYDPFIDGTPEYFIDPPDDDGPAGIGCKYCLTGPLWWFKTNRGWRLADAQGKIHECDQYTRERRDTNAPPIS